MQDDRCDMPHHSRPRGLRDFLQGKKLPYLDIIHSYSKTATMGYETHGYTLPGYEGWAYIRRRMRNVQLFLRLRHGVLTVNSSDGGLESVKRLPVHGMDILVDGRKKRLTIASSSNTTDAFCFQVATIHELQGWTESLKRAARWGFLEFYVISSRKHNDQGVLSAVRKDGNQMVTVRLCRFDDTSADEVRGIRDEITILESVRSPSIVRIVDVLEAQREIVVVMQPLHSSVYDFVRSRDCLVEKEVRDIMHQVLRGLACIQMAGYVHGDVCAQNVRFSDAETSQVKLCGLQYGAHLDAEGYLPLDYPYREGAPYVAPECVSGMPCRASIDIWSAGCLTYFMISGKLPRTDLGEENLFRTAKSKWKAVSKPCRELLLSMLDRNPGRRPSAAAALEHEWFYEILDDVLPLPGGAVDK